MKNEKPQILNSEEVKNVTIAECTIRNRNFVITVDKRIFEKCKDGSYKECLKYDEDTNALRKFTEPPKSLDIER